MRKLFLLFFFLPFTLFAQKSSGKKILQHEDLVTWQQLKSTEITADGKYVLYTAKGEETDGALYIHDTETSRKYTFPRGQNPDVSADGRFVVFKIKPHRDSVLALKRKKATKEELPNDTLAVYELATKNLVKVPDVQSYQMPKKGANILAYLREPETAQPKQNEPATGNGVGLLPASVPVAQKKESKKNGAKLTIRDLASGREEFLRYVTDYQVAEESDRVIYYTTSDDTTYLAGVYIFDADAAKNFEVMTDTTYTVCKKLTLAKDGSRAAFVAEADTTDSRVHDFDLYFWQDGRTVFVAGKNSDFIPEDFAISEHHKLVFSENNERLFFGLGKKLPLPDTTLAEEERAKVEVWTTQDKRLYTQQKSELKEDKERSYLASFIPDKDKITVYAGPEMPEVRTTKEMTARWALGYDETPYLRQASWEGFPLRKEVYKVDMVSGERTIIAENLKADPRLSAAGKFIVWYNHNDSSWYAHNNATDNLKRLTDNDLGVFYDELNDRPMQAYDYRSMGWTQDDAAFFIYDRYDIWRVTPDGKDMAQRLTRGRENKLQYRYIRTDPEQTFFEPNEEILLHVFDEKTKGSGYARLNVGTGKVTDLIFDENLYYGRSVKKAKDADTFVFTRENFETFPNLHLTDGKFKKTQQITDLNPQQKDYAWGTAEAYTWTAFDGQKIEGTLIKPAGFSPKEKYPMLVNFYERSSNRLHRHRAPYPHRSTINYAFYASRGYLIFNPDVPYTVGYPGESAYNSVVSGVESLIKKGYVDADRIGAQGHSWGGYQVAHLATKTDLFAAIESGAPVVNMTSAYGGIRWASGRSRMFQYERTQSRIGGTLWEKPELYLENSPLFNTDKINTPILILHNDKDGAVPWYQGIEWFVALRRLDKKAWLLNYNDEPHWPIKLPNRKDFNVKMQQFFDHYLKGEEMPQWMREGVPAIEAGE